MSALGTERILSVHHWNDGLFSFKTTRDPGLRFANGQFDPATDRGMICGSPAMLKEISSMLDGFSFQISPHIGVAGDYVIERVFVEK